MRTNIIHTVHVNTLQFLEVIFDVFRHDFRWLHAFERNLAITGTTSVCQSAPGLGVASMIYYVSSPPFAYNDAIDLIYAPIPI